MANGSDVLSIVRTSTLWAVENKGRIGMIGHVQCKSTAQKTVLGTHEQEHVLNRQGYIGWPSVRSAS